MGVSGLRGCDVGAREDALVRDVSVEPVEGGKARFNKLTRPLHVSEGD